MLIITTLPLTVSEIPEILEAVTDISFSGFCLVLVLEILKLYRRW